MSPPDRPTAFHALLIGIDHYLPNANFDDLQGCVRDVSHVEMFLRNRVGLVDDNLLKLTSSGSGDADPVEPFEQWPNYENIVRTFKRLCDVAAPGDQVYVHYAGHGGRASTTLPQIKGEGGVDEALVPFDIGRPEARYVRDHELARLLVTMVEKGLIVTVVLDSCHSGGMTRGRVDDRIAIRGSGVVDRTPRPAESLVASDRELAKTWRELTSSVTRSVESGSGWLPEPQGYVLLAGCRPSEQAFEYAFDGEERNGALTYWLLDSMRDLRSGVTYKMLQDRIVPKVHSQFVRQTPQLQGEGDRVVFGRDHVEPWFAVSVVEVARAEGRVLISAGQVHGLRKGAQFAVYRHGAEDLEDVEKRQALVEIVELGAATSWASIIGEFGDGVVEQGGQAVLVGKGSAHRVQKVGFIKRDDLEAAVDQDGALDSAERTVRAYSEARSGWIEVAEAQEQIAYQVVLDPEGNYEIWDPSGNPFANLRPPLTARDATGPDELARRLVHLAKYHAIVRFENHDTSSPLAGRLLVELAGWQREYDAGDPLDLEPFEDAGETPSLAVGQWTVLRVRNRSSQVLNVTVLDLQCDWGVKQVYPGGAGDYFIALDPDEELTVPLRVWLPDHYDEGADILKVFATVEPTNFRWLELPPLDQPVARGAAARNDRPKNSLEELLSVFSADRPSTRHSEPVLSPTAEWVTAQVELRVGRH